MLLPLSECCHLTGLSRSALLKAIKRGRISATKDERNGQWAIDSAELGRVYELRSPGDTAPTPNDTGSEVVSEKLRSAELMISALRDERDFLRRRLEDESTTVARLSMLLNDARTSEDKAAHQATPPPSSSRAWFWAVIVALTGACSGLVVWILARG